MCGSARSPGGGPVAAIVGTGLGGGIIDDGRVIRGAGRIGRGGGHVPIPLDGLLADGQPMPRATAASRATPESVASLTGIRSDLLAVLAQPVTKGHDFARLRITVAAKLVREYAEDGDEMALAIFRQQATAIGRLFTMAANFLDPDA